MPHPAKKTIGVSSSTLIVLERPTIAARIGAIAAGWVHLEEALRRIYALLSSFHMPMIEGFEPSHHPIAGQVFEEVTAVKARLDLVYKLCRAVAPERAAEFKTNIQEPMRKLANRRNAVVHGSWGVSTDYPDALIEMGDPQNQIVWREDDLVAISADIEGLNATMIDFYVALKGQRQANATHNLISMTEFAKAFIKDVWTKVRRGENGAWMPVPKKGSQDKSIRRSADR